MQLTARNTDLGTLRNILRQQHARRLDVVVPASKLAVNNARLVLTGVEPIIDGDGVTDVNGTYDPTDLFHDDLAGKLGVPTKYMRRMVSERPDLYDANVNGWLHGNEQHPEQPGGWGQPDPRNFLIRAFKGDDGPGVARTILSDRFRIIDNFDVLMAALQGIQQAGINVEVRGCDLTEKRMRVRFAAPDVNVLAPALLAGYRSPFTGQTGADNPVLEAGFSVANSDVGAGRFVLAPYVIARVCSNGMTITKDQMARTHVGQQLDEGLIEWSADTERKALDLVTSMTGDAVRTFLSADYLDGLRQRLEAEAGHPVEKPQDTIRVVAKELSFTEAEADGIMAMFIKGGQLTAGGVMQAVTAYAQHDGHDGDRQAELEAAALPALTLAAAA